MQATVKIQSDGPVIMVDDSDADVLIARKSYERAGLTNPFLTMNLGQDLLDYLDQVLQGTAEMPALVLLDVNMPEMDGFEVLRALRARPQFREVPVISMLTNSDRPADLERALELGANAFSTKPMYVADYVAFFQSLRA